MASFISKSFKVGGTGDSIYQKTVIENVLQKPYTTLESYYDFWSHMESTGHATYFFTSLVQKLNAAEKKGLQIALGVTSSSVLATLLLLALYYPVQPDDPTLKSLIKKLGLGGRAQKERASAAGGTSESMTVETLLELVGKAEQTNTLISFVERCSDVEPAASSSKSGRAGGGGGGADPMEGGSIADCLLAGFLHRRWCASRPDVAALLKTLLGILRLGHPLLTSARAMALLLLLRQLLASVSSLSDEQLKEMRQAVQPLLLWAQPLGGEADRLLGLVGAELRMRTAASWLQMGGWLSWAPGTPASLPASLPLGPLMQAVGEACTVHFVLNEYSDWGRAFRALLVPPTAAAAASAAAQRGVEAALVPMLQQTLAQAGPAPPGSPGDVGARVGGLSGPSLLRLAAAAIALAREAPGCDEAAVASGLSELLALAGKLVEGEKCPSGGAGAKAGGAQGGAGKGGAGGDGAVQAQAAGLPRVPLTFRLLEGDLDGAPSEAQVREMREAAEMSGHRRYLYNPLIAALYARLVAVDALLPKGGSASGAGGGGMGGSPLPPTVNVCAAGGDGTLHRLLQAYVVLRCAYPTLCARARLKFFLVPIGRRNSLAHFIARHDGWYRRHIYAPHACGQPTVPHLIVPHAWQQLGRGHGGAHGGAGGGSATARDSAKGGAPPPPATLPQAPLRNCLCDYLRDAQATVDVTLFEAQCWVTPPVDPDGAGVAGAGAGAGGKSKPQPPFITIAFCTSVELAPAASEKQAADAGAPLALQCSMADPYGVSYSSPSHVFGRFSSLTFHTFSDEQPLHYPSGGRLLMRCTHTPAVGAKGGGGSRAVEMPTRYIKTATISNAASTGEHVPGMPRRPPETPRERKAAQQQAQQGGGGLEQRFSLYIDGELYGPFAHVVVTPCVPPGAAEAIALPVQTFFPLETPVV